MTAPELGPEFLSQASRQEPVRQIANIPKMASFAGRMMKFLGLAVQVQDERSGEVFYAKPKAIMRELVGSDVVLSKEAKALLTSRVVEIATTEEKGTLSKDKLSTLFARYTFEKKAGVPLEAEVVHVVEALKQKLSDIPHIYYDTSLREAVNQLRPGDIIVRKYHEENKNPIVDLQKFFGQSGYQEAYKCSHLAMFLGEINGEYWIAEAVMPHGDEAQVRRVKIDDPRFDLAKKNQYLVFRNRDPEVANEAARLASNYTIKMHPEKERPLKKGEHANTIKYNFFEAARSLIHSSKLNFFGKHRLFKYYTDYKNGIPFEYLGMERGFFCSHFAMMNEALGEMNKSEYFNEFMKVHPVPEKYDARKTGMALTFSKLAYSIKKGVWARYMALRYAKEIGASVTTKLDPLRSSPQDAVNYMMKHPGQYSVVGMITRRNDV